MRLLRFVKYVLTVLVGFSIIIVYFVDMGQFLDTEFDRLYFQPHTAQGFVPISSNDAGRGASIRGVVVPPKQQQHKSLAEGVGEREVSPEELLLHRTLVRPTAEDKRQTATPTSGQFVSHFATPLALAERRQPEDLDLAAEEQQPLVTEHAPVLSETTFTDPQMKPEESPVLSVAPVSRQHGTVSRRLEKKPKPKPLLPPAAPVDQPLFVLVGDFRSGSEWILSVLNQHEHVCASGSFPTAALLPAGFPWLSDDNTEKGCTYAFVRDHVQELTATAGEGSQARCTPDYLESVSARSDPLESNLPRVCQFIEALNGNYTEEAVLKLFVAGAFRSEQYVACSCPADSRVRGIKVLSPWIRELPVLQETALAGTKVIRFHRENLWARYMSLLLAQATGVWSVTSVTDKDNQLRKLAESSASISKLLTISLDDMLRQFTYMSEVDRQADAWADTYGLETLWLEYEACRSNMSDCFERIYDFLGVDKIHVSSNAKLYTSPYLSSNSDRLLQHVSNPELVREALGAYGMGAFIGMKDDYQAVQHLVYEPVGFLTRTLNHFPGVQTTVIARNPSETKFSAVVSYLKGMNPNALVVISDSEGVVLNTHIRSSTDFYKAVANARSTYDELTRNHQTPGAVVISAGSHCCASALTHVEPGAFFDVEGRRKSRSCNSGEKDCQWNGDDKAVVWQTWMKGLATKRSATTIKNVYLEASLIAGRATDLLAFVAATDIAKSEDDRAVLTDYMHHQPDRIVLDYEQRMFGKGFDGAKNTRNQACLFDVDLSISESVVVSNAEALPLFVHDSRDLGCTATVAEQLPRFPAWDEKGIAFQPLLDHIDELSEKDQSLIGIDRHFGPEIPYIVDEKGIWTSGKIRGRIDNETQHFRNVPTDELLKLAHEILLTSEKGALRWRALQRSVKSGGFLYYGWYGDFKECNYLNSGDESIPLFTTCAIAGCNHAFPTPAYMTVIDSQQSTSDWYNVFQRFDEDYPWESKIRKVVWRGALSENDPTKVFDSARWRLCKLAAGHKSGHFDVGLVDIPSFLTEQIDIDVSQVGGLVGPIKPMNEFQRYLAVLDMDGNSWSSRFGTLLCYNSVAVKVEPQYVDYFYYDLKPWKHYIPVKADLSDLEDNVAFVMDPKNEAVVKDIIASANRWCSERFVVSELASDMLDIWEEYLQRLDHADPNWAQKWMKKKPKLFSSDLALELIG